MEILGITFSVSIIVACLVVFFILIMLIEGLSGGAVITSALDSMGCGCMFLGLVVLITATAIVSYGTSNFF